MIVLDTLPFVTLSAKNQLPSRSGVYFVVHKSAAIVYIGHTDNLKKRWYSHEIVKRLKQDIDWQIYFDESLAKLDEAALISFYKPKFNKRGKYPSRRPVDLNFDDYLLARIDSFQKSNTDLSIAQKCRILIEIGLRYWLPFENSIIYACPSQKESMNRKSRVSLNCETYDRVFEFEKICDISRTEACRVLICLALDAMAGNIASRYL